MVHGALSKAVFLVFYNRAFKEGKVFEAENAIPVAAESACSWPDSGLLRVTPSFYHQVVAAGADFSYICSELPALQIEVLLFSKFLLDLLLELHLGLRSQVHPPVTDKDIPHGPISCFCCMMSHRAKFLVPREVKIFLFLKRLRY